MIIGEKIVPPQHKIRRSVEAYKILSILAPIWQLKEQNLCVDKLEDIPKYNAS